MVPGFAFSVYFSECNHYEKLWLDNCPPEFKAVVHRRYVDDIFLFKSKGHLLSFVRICEH